MLVLGLAVAVTSPVSVVTVIVLLSMPSGRRRAFAFVAGWVLMIAAIAILTVTVLHGQDFSSNQTTPSRAASIVEIAIGALMAIYAGVKWRRRHDAPHAASPPKWLDRLGRTNWLIGVAVGAVMLTYSITVVASAEILKANVSVADDALAFLVFGVASLVTIAAPIVYVIAAPARADATLAHWKAWLLANSGTVALVVLMVVGAALISKGTYDLAA